MIPLLVLLGSFSLLSLLSLVSRRFESIRFRARLSLSVMLLLTGVSHFASSEQFIRMIPPVFPYPEWINAASGVVELLLAGALLSRRHYRIAGAAAAIFLLLVWPANVYNAIVGNEVPGGLELIIPYYLWVRLFFQPLYIWWAVWCTREP